MSTSTMNKNQPQQHVDKAREAAGQAIDKAKEGVGQAAEAAREGLGQVADKAKGAATQAGNAVQSAASTVGHKAEQATSAVGHGMQSLAGTVRHQGPDHGMLGTAAHAVADTLDETGHYIEDKNLSGMMDDMTGLIKRNPIPAVLIGLGIGFLLGRTLRS
jgi:hypothetical protein